ncbi:hypothetical protein ABPG74_002982 [Tetrahymena malaccensis]
MSNMEQNSAKFCTDCNRFYGNPANDNLCSACFKKKFKNSAPVVQQPPVQVQQQQQQPVAVQAVQEPIVVEQPAQNPEVPQKPKQEDHSRCWTCKKKVNLLGIKCKCDFTFCNKHRMPEDHQCEYDHAQFGKDLLKQNNPLVQKAKLEKI